MKDLSGFRISMFGLLFSLLIGFAFASPTGAAAKTNNVLGSDQNNGITLMIDGYSFINNGEGIRLHYTVVQTKSGTAHSANSMMSKPDILIGDNLLHGKNEQHKKIGPKKYAGTLDVRLPDYRHVPTYVEFRTNTLLNQQGQWTIDFTIK